MQTHLADFIKGTPEGDEAEAILRKCVHCGFCTAVCPTYQLLGNELDGPRGRIYLIKQALEGAPATARTRLHLDRCLTCRACEPACPSGVQYGRLADIGRAVLEARVPRGRLEELFRSLLAFVLPSPRRFGALVALARTIRPVLPVSLARRIPVPRPGARPRDPGAPAARSMLVLGGCVQPALAPSINDAAARVLGRLGITLFEAPAAGCCGAVRYHLNRQTDGLDDMRRLIDAWWPLIEARNIEAIVITASGCGVTVKDYGHLLAADPRYRDKAARVSALARDLVEVLETEFVADDATQGRAAGFGPVAFQSPCSLQHGQRLGGRVEALLARAGFRQLPVADGHLCCGSAGTYSLLQPEISGTLRARKLDALQAGGPAWIATANIGCMAHLAEVSGTPVKHWIELLDEACAAQTPAG